MTRADLLYLSFAFTVLAMLAGIVIPALFQGITV